MMTSRAIKLHSLSITAIVTPCFYSPTLLVASIPVWLITGYMPCNSRYDYCSLDHELAVNGVDVVGADNTLLRPQTEDRISFRSASNHLTTRHSMKLEKLIQAKTAVGGVQDRPNGLLDAGPIVLDVVTPTSPASPHSAASGARIAPAWIAGRG